MNSVDKQYFDLVNHIFKNGIRKSDRTGTGTISVFDYTMRFDMSEGFPLITSKKMFTKGIIHELIWFLRGETNIKYLLENDVHIWDGDAYKNYKKNSEYNGPNTALKLLYNKYGDIDIKEFANLILTDDNFAKYAGELGPIYGKQWRSWDNPVVCDIEGWYDKPVDQISELINDLKNNPDSRRLMVSAWNVVDIKSVVLPPCHYGFQCYTQEVSIFERKKILCQNLGKSIVYADDIEEIDLDRLKIPKRKLSLKWNQRSVDVGLGLSFNIASYGLLLSLLAREVNMIPHELIFSGGDCHIYLNHIDSLKLQLNQEMHKLPRLELSNKSIDSLKYEDVEIKNYRSSGVIKMDLSN